jgi:ribonucleotide reductase beta subunit family protein with ferritin-like domain
MSAAKKAKPYCPVLTANPNRFVMFPVQHPDVFALYKKHVACFWTTEEINWSQDKFDWSNKLSEDERTFIKHVLAFFAASDGVVIENLLANVAKSVQMPEARAFYGFQMAMENIHSETYSLAIDTLINKTSEKQHLFRALDTMPTVQKKAQWAQRWIKDSRKFGTMLTAFACVEGIMFSSSFAALFWLKERGVMPGLCFSNELISRDEGLHTDFAVLLFHKLHGSHRPGKQKILRIVDEAVQLEIEFATTALPVRLLGMNAAAMANYIRFVADRLLRQLGLPAHYKVVNPFKFMMRISIDGKTNFFEKRVAEYRRANVEQADVAFTDAF